MAGTYSQIYLHFVFAVSARRHLLPKHARPEIFKVMAGIVKSIGCHPIAINGYEDHVHVLISHTPKISIPTFLSELKTGTTKFIKSANISDQDFSWQSGYGVFSHAKREIPTLVEYIKNQEQHHAKYTFREEYIALLEEHGVDYDPRYILNEIE